MLTQLAYKETQGVKNTRLSSSILRKRIIAAFAVVLYILTLTVLGYYRAKYLGPTDWGWFRVREAIIGVVLVLGIVQALRKPSKS